MSAIRGSGQATAQADEREFQKGVGWVTIRVWEGPRAAIESLALVLAADEQYSRVQVFSVDNVAFRIRATIAGLEGGGEDDVVNTWEIVGQPIQESVFTNPLVTVACPISDRNKIADKYKSGQMSSLRSVAGVSEFADVDSRNLQQLVEEEKLHYQATQYVLRHTMTAGTYADIVYTATGTDKLWTRAQLPVSTMPGEIVAFLDLLPVVTPPSSLYVHRWLKQPPHLISTVNARPQVVNEWWLYLWPTLTYANHT